MACRRFVARLLILTAALAGAGGVAAATAGAAEPLRISAIRATFVQSEFATHYNVTITGGDGSPGYQWSLALQLVDPPGSPPGAAVDPPCDNKGQPTSTASEFVWHHGDADGCNHDRQGPHGHQGVLTLVVSDGSTRCTAVYLGSETNNGPPARCTAAPAPASSPTSRSTTTSTVVSSTTSTSTSTSTSGWGGPITAGAVIALAFALGIPLLHIALWKDPCSLLKDLCKEASDRAAALRAAAAAARAAATAAHGKARSADAEVTAAAKKLADVQAPPDQGSSASSGDRTVTSYDLQLEREASQAAWQRYKSGEISAQQLEQEWHDLGDTGAIQKLRDADAAHRAERVNQAQADLDAAKQRAADANAAAAKADADALAAETAMTDAEAAAAVICAEAAACKEPPSSASATTGTTSTSGGTTAGGTTDHGGGGGGTTTGAGHGSTVAHQHDDPEHPPCCPSHTYYAAIRVIEASALPVLTKLLGLISGEEHGWSETGSEFWSGTFYCSCDSTKFVTFRARAPRHGLALGGGGGISFTVSSGYDHPGDVVVQVPNMMSGWGMDAGGFMALAAIAGNAAKGAKWISKIEKAMEIAGEAGGAASKTFGPELGNLAEEGMGTLVSGGLDTLKGEASSLAQGAPGTISVPIGLTLQVGVWHVDADEVEMEIDAYSCCVSCRPKGW